MTSMITARVDTEKRKSAEKVFDAVGLTTSAAVNLFICAVAMNGGIPFPIGVNTASSDSHWNSRPTNHSGIRLGSAAGKYNLPPNFDENFDAMDSEDTACATCPHRRKKSTNSRPTVTI